MEAPVDMPPVGPADGEPETGHEDPFRGSGITGEVGDAPTEITGEIDDSPHPETRDLTFESILHPAMLASENLRFLTKTKISHETLTPEQLDQLAEAMTKTADTFISQRQPQAAAVVAFQGAILNAVLVAKDLKERKDKGVSHQEYSVKAYRSEQIEDAMSLCGVVLRADKTASELCRLYETRIDRTSSNPATPKQLF